MRTLPTNPKKNYIINGAMMVSQENGTTVVRVDTGAGYGTDQWKTTAVTSADVYANQQVASVTPGGSPNRFRITATVADASVGAGDFLEIITRIEGLRTADLKSGTASAKTVTLQFGIKAPAGTYCVAVFNSAANRNYVAEYAVTAGEANTDVVKFVTLTLDTTGTWLSDNQAGLDIRFCLMGGSNYVTATAKWCGAVRSVFLCTSNQFNFMGTNGNVFELFDVSLTEGNVAPPFQVPDYASELAACRRYFQTLGGDVANDLALEGYGTSSGGVSITVPLIPTMRAAPTLFTTGAFTLVNVAGITYFTSKSTIAWKIAPSAIAQMSMLNTTGRFQLSARL